MQRQLEPGLARASSGMAGKAKTDGHGVWKGKVVVLFCTAVRKWVYLIFAPGLGTLDHAIPKSTPCTTSFLT